MKKLPWLRLRLSQLFLGLVLSLGIVAPATAVERLTLQLGPFQQSISVSDLERFAKTGELPKNLQALSVIFTPRVQQLLSQRLQLDPQMTDKVLQEWLRSPMSEQLLKTFGRAFPNTRIEDLQAAISLAARQANGLSLVGVLRAIPGKDVTIEATSLIGLALQFNPSYWQSEALGPLLKRELDVNTPRFNYNFNPAELGIEQVKQQTLYLKDSERNRNIAVDLYYANNTQGPLVVMSHGFGADRKFLNYLALHLASYGITVAALEHPGSNATWVSQASISDKPQDLMPASEFVDRPKDVSFLLDKLAQKNQKFSESQGKFNTKQVVVIGHSLGGYTALALAGAELNLPALRQTCKSVIPLLQSPGEWLQCAATDLSKVPVLGDSRIVGAIILNPVVGQLFGETGLRKVRVPTLTLASTEDAFTPAITHQLEPFKQLGGQKYLITAVGATHLSVGNPQNLAQQITLLKERTGEEVEPLRQLIRGVSLAFIKQFTSEAVNYQSFLTPSYAQFLSTPKLALRLSRELPSSISQWLKFVAKSQKN
ncbi:alpha/beta hydrolase [Phormidium sp. LEGE 05292]|uniref:alpha/beta hydrolase n=1 Tax=[Phormidium] sp. LEGE 05292 TaxID=767427 RepID=UPI001882E893|nr:alpha/beta hydrolase [Phormidium sp. LEGE 05292]MBE9226553.1 alpha/beta hydrolase [Phormidium sp. LEGE 05292]